MANITVNDVSGADAQGAGEQTAPALKVRGYWQTVGYRLRYDYATLFFGFMVVLIILTAVFAPLLAPMDPYETDLINRLKPIGYKDFLLGTDELGRDVLSRILYGGRISLAMGILPVVLATLIGGAFGVVAGFMGGRVNMVIMRIMDVFYAFPSILLAVAISGAMGGGVLNGMLSLTLVFIPPMCRIAETATSQVRNLDFVEAARATGAKTFSIIRVHPGQRVGPGADLFLQLGQRQHPARLGAVVPRSGRDTSRAGLGLDAEHPAPGDLHQSAGLRPARGRNSHHVDLLQLGQRRFARGHGRPFVRSER